MNKLFLKLRTFNALFLLAMRLDFMTGIHFFLKYLWIVLLCMTYRFIFSAALLGKEIPLGNDHIGFPLFLISGLALMRLVLTSLKLFEDTLALFKKFGLAEWIKISPTSWWEILISNAAWKGLVLLSEMGVLVIAAHYLIGTPAKLFFQLRVIVTILLMMLAYGGLGMMISGIILLLRHGAFLFPLVNQISVAFGGVLFPTYLLPGGFDVLTSLMPITFALKSVRACLIGAPIRLEMAAAVPLALLALLFLLTGCLLLNFALRWAQKNGTL